MPPMEQQLCQPLLRASPRSGCVAMSSEAVADRANILNINVGVLGHVDSGKTSLVKALSTSLSTAALDKNPQSQARGITLDLGFSAFSVPLPERIRLKMEQQQGEGEENV